MRNKKIVILFSGLTLACCGATPFIDNIIHNGGGNSSAVSIGDPTLTNTYIDIPTKSVTELIDDGDFKTVLFAASSYFYNEAQHIHGVAEGNVAASVMGIPYNQHVVSRRTVNDEDTFFETTAVSAFVKSSEQRYVNSNSYLVRYGYDVSEDGANYENSQVAVFSKENYLNRYGHFNRDLFNYVINDYSFVSGEFVSQDNGLYKFHFILNPDYAAEAYKREVAYMGGASSYPIFSKTELDLTIDSSYKAHSITAYDSYSMPIFGGINCDSALSETFTYSESEIDVPEKKYFEPYFGQSGNGEVDKEKTAFDYLQESLSTLLVKQSDFEGTLVVDGSEIPTYVSLDIPNMNFRLSLMDQLDLFYQKDKAYLLTSNDAYLVNKDNLSEVISYLSSSLNIEGTDLSSLLSSPLVSQIIDDLTMKKDGNKVSLNLPFDEGNLVLELEENDGISTLKSVNFYSEIASFNLVPSSEHDFREIPSDPRNITNLNGLITSLDSVVNSKSVTGRLAFDNLEFQGLKLSLKGSYIFNLDSKKALLSLDLSLMDKVIPAVVYLNNNDVYLNINGLKVSSDLNYLSSLLPGEASSLLGMSNLDIKQLIVFISSNLLVEDSSIGISFDSLDLSSLLGSKVMLNYSNNLTLEFDNGYIELLPSESDVQFVPGEVSCSLSFLVNKVESLIDTYSNSNLHLDIASLNLNGINASGEVDIDLESNNVSMSLKVNLNNIQANLEVYYIDKSWYFKLSDEAKFKISQSQLEKLISPYLTELPSVSSEKLFDAIFASLSPVLSSLKVNSDIVSISLPYQDYMFNIQIDADNKISLSSDLINGVLSTAYVNKSIDEEEYFDLSPIGDFDLTKLVDLFTSPTLINISSLKIYDLVITGEVYVDFSSIDFDDVLSSLVAEGSLRIDNSASQNVLENLYFQLKDGKIKLVLNNNTSLAIELELHELLTSFGLDTSSFDLSKLNLNSLIESLVTENGELKMDLNLPYLGKSNVSISDFLSFESADLSFTLEKTEKRELKNVSALINKATIDLAKSLFFDPMMKNGKFSGEFNFALPVLNDTYQIGGSFYIDITNGFNFKINATLSSSSLHAEEIQIIKYGEFYYVSLGKQAFKLSADNLYELVIYIKDKFELNIDEELLNTAIGLLKGENIELEFNLNNIGDLLYKLNLNYIIDNLNLSLSTFSVDFGIDLSRLGVSSYIEGAYSMLSNSLELNMIGEYSFSMTANMKAKEESIVVPSDFDDLNTLISTIDYAYDLYEFIIGFEQGKFNLTGEINSLPISAYLTVETKDVLKFQIDDLTYDSHIIDLKYGPFNSESALFISYNKMLKGYIYEENISSVISQLTEMLFDSDSVYEITSLLSSIDLDTLIQGIEAKENEFVISLYLSDSFAFDLKLVRFEGKITSFNLSNSEMDLQLNVEEYNQAKSIQMPSNEECGTNLGSYYDLNNLPSLLTKFNETSQLGKYSIQGNLALQIPSLGVSIGGTYTLNISIDENRNPVINADFYIDPVKMLFITLAGGGHSHISYVPSTSNLLYIENLDSGDSSNFSFNTADSNYLGTKDNLLSLLDIILRPSSTVRGILELVVPELEPVNLVIEEFIQSYSYTDTSVILALDGAQISSSFNSMNVTLEDLVYEGTTYLGKFSAEVGLGSMATIVFDGELINIDQSL